jgi:hypothetical protein
MVDRQPPHDLLILVSADHVGDQGRLYGRMRRAHEEQPVVVEVEFHG